MDKMEDEEFLNYFYAVTVISSMAYGGMLLALLQAVAKRQPNQNNESFVSELSSLQETAVAAACKLLTANEFGTEEDDYDFSDDVKKEIDRNFAVLIDLIKGGVSTTN